MTGSVFPDDWRGSKQLEIYDLKGAIEVVLSALNISGFTIHRARVEYLPGQSAVLAHDGEEIVRFGRLHPRVASLYKSKEMPEGFHSLAFRVIYRGEGRTLTDEEVAGMHERVRALLEDRFGAQLR